MSTGADQDVRLSRAATAVLAVAAGGAIANDYALQPSLATIASDFGVPVALIATLASAAMIGYLVGLALLVPLVDRVSPRALIPGQLAALALTLALAAAAPSPAVLIGCFVVVGATTTVAAQSSAVVGKYGNPDRRARGIGAISAGISAGILLSRFVGGILTQWCGWRRALLVFAGFAVLAALGTLPLLPARRPNGSGGYRSSLHMLLSLLRESSRLRRRAGAGMLWFFAFNLVWIGLAVRLAAPPYSLTAERIGLYSLAGTLGLVVTRIAGKLADRIGSRAVIVGGLIMAALSAIVLTVSLGHPAQTAAMLAIFDAGCFAAQVANQASVVAIHPARSGALSAAYLTLYYAAGALGTAIAGMIATRYGWSAITLGAAAAVIAAAVLAAADSHRTPRTVSKPLSGHANT